MRHLAVIAALCSLLTLGGCLTLQARDLGEGQRFTLSDVRIKTEARKNGALSLMVRYPATPGDLETFRIALIRPDGRRDYYADARWAEFLPTLVQSALIDSFEHSGLFKMVISDEMRVRSDFILTPEIREFQAVYSEQGKPPEIHIRFVAALYSVKERRDIDSFSVEAHQKAAAESMQGIQSAFREAFREAQTQLMYEASDAVLNFVAETQKTPSRKPEL